MAEWKRVCKECNNTISNAVWWSEDLCLKCMSDKRSKNAKDKALSSLKVALIGASHQLAYHQEVWLVYIDMGWDGIDTNFQVFATEQLADTYMTENPAEHGFTLEKQRLGVIAGKYKELRDEVV